MKNKDASQIDEELSSLPKPTMSYESKQAIHSILLKELHSQSPSKKRSESSKHFLINIAGISIFALLAFFVFNSIQENNNFSPAEQSSSMEDTISFHGMSYKLKQHIKYKGTYIGDNSSVDAILTGLPGAAYKKTIELQTKIQPYGLAVNYGLIEEENLNTKEYDEYWTDRQRILLYNATVLFMVIDNVDSIDFHLGFEDEKMNQFQFTRAEIEELYGREMANYTNDPDAWKQEVLSVIKNDSAIYEFYTNRQM